MLKRVKRMLANWLLDGGVDVGDPLKIRPDYVTFPPLSADPTLSTGTMWFRGDLGRFRYSPDGVIVKDFSTVLALSELAIDVDKDWLSKKIYNAMLVDNYTQFFDHFPGSAMNSIPLKPALDGDKIRGLTPSYTRVNTGGTTTVTSSYVEMYASGSNLDEGWRGNETLDIPPPVTMEALVNFVTDVNYTEVWHKLLGSNNSFTSFTPEGAGHPYDTFRTYDGSSQTYINLAKISRGVWHTVKLVRDVNEARIYIDGELKGTITTTLPNGPWTVFLDARAGYAGGTCAFRWDWYLIRRGT